MINIKVLKDCAEVSYNLPGSSKKQIKVVSISDIPNLFDTKITFDSDAMPIFGNENAYGIHRIIQKDNQIIALVQCLNPFLNILHTNFTDLTEKQREDAGIGHIKKKAEDYLITKDDGSACYKDVYFPNLLMSIQLKSDGVDGWRVSNSGVLCFKEQFITKETQLYRFPFSNIYRGSTYGSICWGNEIPIANNLAQSVSLIHSFLGAVMNTHLFEPFYVKNFEFKCSSEFLSYLSLRSEELESFPYKDVPLQKIIKYQDLINYLTQNWK